MLDLIHVVEIQPNVDDIQPNVDEIQPSLTANAEVATVLGSIPASSDIVESEARQMKQC